MPLDARLGEPGEGFKVAMATLDIFRSTVGAAALGFARRALDEALERTRNAASCSASRSPICSSPRRALADMATDDRRRGAARLSRRLDARTRRAARVTREAAMAKLFATEAAQRVIDGAVQLHGGLGVRKGAKVERLYREIRALRIYEGTTEIQKLVIAREMLSSREAARGGVTR